MLIRTPFLLLAMSGAVCFGLAATAGAQIRNISVGKQYAYFKAVPGQPPNHYRDDGPINGSHKVHTVGLGKYGKGNLSDGAVSTVAGGGPGTTHLAFWALLNTTPAPAADIIFDLGSVSVINDFVIGTVVLAASNNNAPDDVTISYSLTGVPASYGSAQSFNLEKLFGPLQDGHHDLKLKGRGAVARYVKFSFDGGSMREPNGTDPNEKYMLDEITINGIGSSCAATSTNYGKGLAGKQGVPTLATSAPPGFGKKINLMTSNSSGAATAGLLVVGLKQISVAFLGGSLLAEPAILVGMPVPISGSLLPITVPTFPCGTAVYVQVLQRDAAAPAGVAMTPGLRLILGK